MRERRRRRHGGGAKGGKGSSRIPLSAFSLLLFGALLCWPLLAVAFPDFRLFGVSFRPVLTAAWPSATMSAVSTELPLSLGQPSASPSLLEIEHAVASPDHVLLILKHPTSLPDPELKCIYFPPRSSPSSSKFLLPPIPLASPSPSSFVHCPVSPSGFSISLSPSGAVELPPVQPYQWLHLTYAAIIDPHDNATIVFSKGLTHRPARLYDPSRFECIFGWDLSKQQYLLTTAPVSIAQEIVRCRTPLSILARHWLPHAVGLPPLVSIRYKGRGSTTIPSVARLEPLLLQASRPIKKYLMCACTMLRNQAQFLHEWIMYHSRIGVQRWFIYDNNSDDNIEQVINTMGTSNNYNVTRHLWPWVKSQEAGFAHCTLRARGHCEWVGFIDVDEFFYFPADVTLHDVLRNYSHNPSIGELRTACHSFGPSGRKTIPPEGVMAGYTCRMNAPERHKSIVRPAALNPSLLNVVHHFHLMDGVRYENIGQGVMVINHYKYQVWEVFKEKFHRRVATYVADWQDKENVGSKDRAPGLGTKAVEPADWSSRFCEVNDTGLRDWVLRVFADPRNGLLPWRRREL